MNRIKAGIVGGGMPAYGGSQKIRLGRSSSYCGSQPGVGGGKSIARNRSTIGGKPGVVKRSE